MSLWVGMLAKLAVEKTSVGEEAEEELKDQRRDHATYRVIVCEEEVSQQIRYQENWKFEDEVEHGKILQVLIKWIECWIVAECPSRHVEGNHEEK